MVRQRISDSLLACWFGLLSGVAALAVLQAGFFPSGPRAEVLPAAMVEAALRQAHLSAVSLPPRPARRTEAKALSPQLGWRLAGGEELWIVSGAVRHFQNLQIPFLALGHPSLQMRQRRLDVPVYGSQSGLIAGHPALQTCLVRQLHGPALPRATYVTLLQASDPRRQLPTTLQPEAWLGIVRDLLTPRSFSCVLVTLRSGSSRPLPADLWRQLLPSLQTALQSGGPR